jgi:hypothetical protein
MAAAARIADKTRIAAFRIIAPEAPQMRCARPVVGAPYPRQRPAFPDSIGAIGLAFRM